MDSRTDIFIHDEAVWKVSLTWNQWVPLSCFDVLALDSYSDVFGDREIRPGVKNGFNGSPFFFRNFPIRHVFVVGFVRTAEYIPNMKAWKLEISDGTGPLVLVKYPTVDQLPPTLKNGFVEIYGEVVERGSFPREISARTLRHSPDIKMTRVFDLYQEAFQVRREYLEQGWDVTIAQMAVKARQDAQENNPEAMRDATVTDIGIFTETTRKFLSFNRMDSVLVDDERFKHLPSIDGVAA